MSSSTLPRLNESRLDDSIAYALALAVGVTKHNFFEAVGHPHELRPLEFIVLQLAAANPDATAKRLCRVLAVPAPQMTLILDRMERRLLIQRATVDTDRRAHFIRLTARGQSLADQTREQSMQAERQRLKMLSPAEQGMLIELLNKVSGRHGGACEAAGLMLDQNKLGC